jgi:hypothetical protein
MLLGSPTQIGGRKKSFIADEKFSPVLTQFWKEHQSFPTPIQILNQLIRLLISSCLVIALSV